MSTPATSKFLQVALEDALRVSGRSSAQTTGNAEGVATGRRTGRVEGEVGGRDSRRRGRKGTGAPGALTREISLAPIEDWSQAWHQVRAREVRALRRRSERTIPGRRIAVLGRPRGSARARPGVHSCLLTERTTAPASPPPVALTARGRLVAVAAMVSLVLVVAGGGGLALHRLVTETSTEQAQVRQVRVHPGQTLWDIAHRVAPDSDVRTTVDRIVELNGLSGAGDLRVGENLRVPVTHGD